MNYFSWKNLIILSIVLVVVTVGLGVSHSLGQRNQTIDVFSKFKGGTVYSDNLSVNTNNLVQGDNLNVSFSVYNMDDKEQGVAVGVYLINSNKTYDASNFDYAAQKQQAIIKSGEKKDFGWKIPLYLNAGSYKMLYWIHKVTDGNETYYEDKWFQQQIRISQRTDVNIIQGEDSNADQGLVLHDLLIKPKHFRTGQKLSATYRINNYESKSADVVSGVFILDKNKQYTYSSLDQILPSQKATILGGDNHVFAYDETLNLKPGEYRILVWLHRIDSSGENVVFDYWAPGNIIVDN